jgi:glycine/serine hydroxymethyltransferase
MIKEVLSQVHADEARNKNFLHLTANEAPMSETARAFLGSKLSERYYAGAGVDGIVDFGSFTQVGMKGVSELVTRAEAAAKDMLGASVVNLSPLSGIHAMTSAIYAATKPEDTVMSLRPDQGGHFLTSGILERAGRKNVHATFDSESLEFDFDKTAETFHNSEAKALYLDPMYYISPYNLVELRKNLGEDATIIYDASHTLGLIMGKRFQSPLREGADVLVANTHKSFPGPQKGIIAFRDQEFGEKANAIVNQSVSSAHTHHLISLAITTLEMEAFGKDYADQMVTNANTAGEAFTELGYDVRRTGTQQFSENHQVHVFIDDKGERLDLYKRLVDNNISTNFADSPGNRPYIRLGTQGITRQGMKEGDTQEVALFVDRALKGEKVKDAVVVFNSNFPKIHYSFDQ